MIRWGHRSVNAPETLTFVLRYRVRGGLRLGEERDAVIWEALSVNRGAGAIMDRVTVTVRLPPVHIRQIQEIQAWGSDSLVQRPDPRTVKYILTESMLSELTKSLQSKPRFAVGLYFPHGLVDASTPNWKGASWVFEKTRLISLFPTVNWARATDFLYWALRFSPFGLFALLFVAIRIRNSRWPDADYSQGPAGLTTHPSDLPAPAVSVLFNRKVGPQTYLSILVDMLQKGNLTIKGRYDESDKERKFHSGVNLVRQFEPDQPWERVVYGDLPVRRATSEELTGILKKRKNAIRTHLDELLQSRGFFDEPPLQVMADQGQGWMAQFGWFLASVILALGVGLWVNFWLPWWAGAAVGIPIAVVFLVYAFDDTSGRLIPTPVGLLEISRWAAFSRSIGDGRVSPSLDPSQPDPLLPYAVALNEASQWVNDINALPPWFLPAGPGNRPQGASTPPTVVSSAPTPGIWPEARTRSPGHPLPTPPVAPAVTAAAKSSHSLQAGLHAATPQPSPTRPSRSDPAVAARRGVSSSALPRRRRCAGPCRSCREVLLRKNNHPFSTIPGSESPKKT